MRLIDTHTHLDFPHFKKDRAEVLRRAEKAGVQYIVNVGSNLRSSIDSIELSKQYQHIYATVGIHPHDAKDLDQGVLEKLAELVKEKKVVAVGEIGLDYHYEHSPRDIQREAFRKQLELALAVDLPVVIHSREAEQDTLRILREAGSSNLRGIMHCFSGSLAMAKNCLALGFFLAFGGVITFTNAVELRNVVKTVPLERILIETDCPYLTPHPHRGKRNEPAYVKLVAEQIVLIKGITLEEVAAITSENAGKIYRIKGR